MGWSRVLLLVPAVTWRRHNFSFRISSSSPKPSWKPSNLLQLLLSWNVTLSKFGRLAWVKLAVSTAQNEAKTSSETATLLFAPSKRAATQVKLWLECTRFVKLTRIWKEWCNFIVTSLNCTWDYCTMLWETIFWQEKKKNWVNLYDARTPEPSWDWAYIAVSVEHVFACAISTRRRLHGSFHAVWITR